MPEAWRACRRIFRSGCALRRRYRSLPWLLLVDDPVPHIAARRRFNGLVLRAAGARRRLLPAAAVTVEPFRPARPPAAFVLGRARQPRFGLLGIRATHPMAAPVFRRGIYYARDVAARAEHERLVLAAHQVQR